MASRLLRPEVARERLVVTPRDLDILRAVRAHRCIRTDQLKQLLFPNTTDRSAQQRLHKLWRHSYLDRVFLASVVGGERRPPRGPGVPIYTLDAKGRSALHGEEPGHEAPRELASPSNIQHDLVVTDFLVALQGAVRARADLWLVEALHDWDLWKRLSGRKTPELGGPLLPDGAVTLERAGLRTRETYYLEVVRAGVKAGLDTLREKMLRYAEANHRGAFRQLYGHDRLRAVLIATTSEERAEHFRRLAESLPHGRALFAFAAYEERNAEGRPVPRFAAKRILSLPWKTADGQAITLGGDTPSGPP